MALSSPYDVLVQLVRSEVGDILPPPDQVFTDDLIIQEINSAIQTKVNPDLGDLYTVSSDSLDPNILTDKTWKTCAAIAAAERLVNARYQAAVRQNIGIAKGSTRINVDPLVKSLKEALDELRVKYGNVILQSWHGIVQVPSDGEVLFE